MNSKKNSLFFYLTNVKSYSPVPADAGIVDFKHTTGRTQLGRSYLAAPKVFPPTFTTKSTPLIICRC